jgi:serine/threonine-protein kinase RsbT
VIVTAWDTGPGMRIEEAMQDGFSTRGGLGLGLAGARSLVDDFLVESRVGEGTTVTLRKWASAQAGPRG